MSRHRLPWCLLAAALVACESPRPGTPAQAGAGGGDARQATDGAIVADAPPAPPGGPPAPGTDAPAPGMNAPAPGPGPDAQAAPAADMSGAPGVCTAPARLCGGRCLEDSTAACGPACTLCRGTENVEVSCVKGSCQFTCLLEYAACGDQRPETTGCLTDIRRPENCGACGRRCDGQPCTSEGICPASVLARLNLGEIGAYPGNHFDGQDFYFSSDGELFALSKNGGQPRLVRTQPGRALWEFAVLGEYIYWKGPGPECPILRAPKAGGQPQTLVPDTGCTGDQYRFGQAGNRLYWIRQDGQAQPRAPLVIERMSLPSGAVERVAQDSTGFGPDVAFDETGAYWLVTDASGIQIRRGVPGEASWRTFYSTTEHSSGNLLLADAGFVYWIENRQSIKRMARDGSEPSTVGESPVPISDAGRVRALASGAELIIIGGYEAAVRVPMAGGKVITLVPDQRPEVAAAGADDRHIYWLTTEGVVSRVIR